MAFLPENLSPMNSDPNESSEDEPDNPNHFRKGIMHHQLDCSGSFLRSSFFADKPVRRECESRASGAPSFTYIYVHI